MNDESSESAISDHEVSPWSCCPECGEIWLKVVCVLERGSWVDLSDGRNVYQIDMEHAPKIGGYRVTGIECTTCGHTFGLRDVGFKIEDWAESDDNDEGTDA